MGVKGTLLGLNTRYPTKTETHNPTTESRRAKTLAVSHELPVPDLLSKELPEEISKGTQSQLIE